MSRACLCLVAMVVPLMQSIIGGNDCTYTCWYARFAMPAMFRALEAEVRWLLISTHDSGGPGDGTLASQALSHLFDAEFCSRSVWDLSWGAKSLLTASTESASNPLNYSHASKYEFVLWGNGISMLVGNIWSIFLRRKGNIDHMDPILPARRDDRSF